MASNFNETNYVSLFGSELGIGMFTGKYYGQYVGYTDFFPNRNPFSGIYFGSYKGLYLPIESNINLGISLSSPISLGDRTILSIKGALNYENPYDFNSNRLYPDGNTMECHFTLTLIDANNNSSSLTSRMRSNGFQPREKYVPTAYENVVFNVVYNGAQQEINSIQSIPSNIFFRVGDFYHKNPSFGITHINQMILSFGPDHGSTYAHLCLDHIVALRNF